MAHFKQKFAFSCETHTIILLKENLNMWPYWYGYFTA